MEYATYGILALAWIDIENLTEYPENGRLTMHFGMKEYEVEEMPEMYNGIFVKAFSLFHDEVLQYYITENVAGEEQVTESNIIFGSDRHYVMQEGRFSRINDILVSLSVQDTTTAWQLVEEYMQQDFCARELFRVL